MFLQTQLLQYQPKVICYTCLANLKLSLKLKQQFEKSMESVQKWLEVRGLHLEMTCEKEENTPPIDNVEGYSENNLKNVPIVGEDCKANQDLGRNINAEIANKKLDFTSSKSHTSDTRDHIVNKTFVSDPKTNLKRKIHPKINNISDNHVLHKESDILDKKFSCRRCDNVYHTKCRYLKHIKECSGQLLHSCRFCPKKFSASNHLRYHVRINHQKPPFTCMICKEIFQTISQYSYHKEKKHSDSNNICNLCGKSMATPTSLRRHISIHGKKETECVCPVCGKTFHYKSGLFYHMKIHRKEMNYTCEYCDRKFYTHSHKARHELTHTGERPYRCKFCNKGFFSTTEVKKHEYIHTGLRPIKCDYCEKTFSSRFNYKLHLFSHTGPYVCCYCQKGFVTNEVLKYHCIRKHKEGELEAT